MSVTDGATKTANETMRMVFTDDFSVRNIPHIFTVKNHPVVVELKGDFFMSSSNVGP